MFVSIFAAHVFDSSAAMSSDHVGSDPEQPPLSSAEIEKEKKEHDFDDERGSMHDDPFAGEASSSVKYKTMEWW